MPGQLLLNNIADLDTPESLDYDVTPAMFRALLSVVRERARQEQKCEEKRQEGQLWRTCADPAMSDEEKLAVLTEEVGEVARELCEARAARRPPAANLKTELVQVAAIAVAWIEALEEPAT